MRRTLAIVTLLLPLLFGGMFVGHAMDEGHPKSKHGWLGVSTSDMTPRLAKSMHLKTKEGALVKSVIEDGPAEQAGIKEDDIILQFNGTKISDGDDLLKEVRKTRPGTAVSIVVSRNDEKKTLKATLDQTPDWFAAPFVPHVPAVPHVQVLPPRFTMFNSMSSYGLSCRDLNKQLGKYFGAPGGRGVLVEEVEEGSSADSGGFQAGDVIVKVQNDEIAQTHDIWDALEDMKEGEIASVEVIRKGASQKLTLRIDEPARYRKSFRFHSFEVPEFDNREFRREMERLQRELHNMGKDMESHTRDLGKKLREELGTSRSL
jgi:serine protease Do